MKVLLGIGGSDRCWEALSQTVARANEAGDDLTVAVYEDDAVGESTATIADRVREEVDEAGLDADVRSVSGHPGGALVEIADGEGFDRLVVAGGSRSTLGKIQLGGVAEFVVLNSERR
ncbi:universal stress protein [Halapricum sp. CBA1109]|uniref:universal stress protein n=1 Tax=Halapricum sp. CBA1109 TaxID=2668068 RepID=UPI0012F8D783|nr:universal stress protein [Halapricum sp. CBA1109]MUV90660.1 universal stress protein [Halapricum sp. CBA1109]